MRILIFGGTATSTASEYLTLRHVFIGYLSESDVRRRHGALLDGCAV
jgi:hypothetical protein